MSITSYYDSQYGSKQTAKTPVASGNKPNGGITGYYEQVKQQPQAPVTPTSTPQATPVATVKPVSNVFTKLSNGLQVAFKQVANQLKAPAFDVNAQVKLSPSQQEQIQPGITQPKPVKAPSPIVEGAKKVIAEIGKSTTAYQVREAVKNPDPNIDKKFAKEEFLRIYTGMKSGVTSMAKGTAGTLKYIGNLFTQPETDQNAFKQYITTETGEKKLVKYNSPEFRDYLKRTEGEESAKKYDQAVAWQQQNKEIINKTLNSAANSLFNTADRKDIQIEEYRRAHLPVTDDKKFQDAWYDPKWVARALADNLPSMLISLGMTSAVTAITKNPQAGIAAGFGTSYAQNAGQTYDEAIKAGLDPDKAAKISVIVGTVNGALDMLPIGDLVTKSANGTLIKKALLKEVRNQIIIQGAEEGITESIQQIVSNAAAKVYDENRSLFAGVPETAFISLIMGGLTGGGNVVLENTIKGEEENKENPPSQVEFTPQEIQDIIVNSNLKDTQDGKALIKASLEAAKTNQNIVLNNADDVIRQAIRVPDTFVSPQEEAAFKRILDNPTQIIDEYIKINKNVANVDDAMDLLKDQGYNYLNADEMTRAGSQIARFAFDKMLEIHKTDPNPTMLATIGGAGSGKSVSTKQLVKDNNYSVVNDSTGARYNFFKENIQKALDMGYKSIDVALVYRDPIDAWENGVLERPRYVGIEAHVNDHPSAVESYLTALSEFANEPRLHFIGIDNNYGEGKAKLLSLDKIRKIEYNKDLIRQKIYEINDKHYNAKTKPQLTKQLYEKLQRDRQSYKDAQKLQQSDNRTQPQPQTTPSVKPQVKPQTNIKLTKDEQQATDSLKEMIFADDLTSAQDLYNAYKEDGLNLPSFEDLADEVSQVQKEITEGIKTELEGMEEAGDPDSPTAKLIEIAEKMSKHFAKPRATFKLTGKQREYSTLEGQSITVGGSYREAVDRIFLASDIEGFAKAIKVLAFKFNKLFTDINTDISHGDIDGGDYEQFKYRIQQAIEERGTYSSRRSTTVKDKPRQEQSKAPKASSKDVKPDEVKTFYRGISEGQTGLEVSNDSAHTYGSGVYLTDNLKAAQDYAEMKKNGKVIEINSTKDLNLYTPTEEERMTIIDKYGKYQDDYIKTLLGNKYDGLKIIDRNGDAEIIIQDPKILELKDNKSTNLFGEEIKLKDLPVKPEQTGMFSNDQFKAASYSDAMAMAQWNEAHQAKTSKPIEDTPLGQQIDKAVTEEQMGKGMFADMGGYANKKYPLADRGEWYGDADYKQRGGKIVEMTPDEFLALAKPLELDEVARDNIDDLKNHILKGGTLDPLTLYDKNKNNVSNTDGRHRAVASRELGIKKVPVIDFTTQTDYKTPSGMADAGGYSGAESFEKQIGKFHQVEMPELVALSKEILGDVPTLKSFKRALGMFYHYGAIKLDPAIFKDEKLMSYVLAHELGHAIDWLPDMTMKRGNILGRIGSLRSYMKKYLAEYPGGAGALTKEDYARLRKEAKELSKKEVEITDEKIIGSEPIKPEEVLAIWNTNTASLNDPLLLKYIQNLTDYQKKSIVVQAMKGTVPKWVTFKREVKETITRKVLMNAPADIKKIYQQLLKEEIEKRALFDRDQVMTELKNLSMKWKPFNPAANPTFTKYRFSSKELYADSISVLFNDPALLKQDAPLFWKGFFNYIGNKPAIADELTNIWDVLNEGADAIFKKRDEAINKAFEKGEQLFTAKMVEKQSRQSNLWHNIKIMFDDKYTPIIEKWNHARKSGKVIDDTANPVYALKELQYLEPKLKNYVEDNFQSLFTKSKEIPDGWKTLGKILQMERSIYERGELANPAGFSPKTAQDYLDGLQKTMSEENWTKIQEVKTQFRKMVQKVVTLAEENGYYSPDMIALMKANPAYATFQVLDYLDTYISPHVYHQVGTLKDVANPATSTVMKFISVYKAIQRNNAKKININFLSKEFADEISDAKVQWNGKGLTSLPPKDPKQGLIIIIEDGKPKGYYVAREIADTLNGANSETIRMLAQFAKTVSLSDTYRKLFTVFNTGFQSFNIVRDFWRYWKNVPDYTLANALTSFPRAGYRYAQALPHLISKQKGIDTKLIREMEDLNILGETFNQVYGQDINPDQQQIERVLEQFGSLEGKEKRTAITPFLKLMDGVADMGDIVEKLPKVAAYIELKGKMPQKELAEFIRTSVGSPDFRTGGTVTPVSNSIFLFSNAIKEGLKTDYRVATSNNVSRSGFWWKTLIANILPKLIMAGIAGGLAGEEAKKWMDKNSEYDKTSYILIPLGITKTGKAISLRIPQDETGRLIGGLFWKAINLDKRNSTTAITDLFDLFSFGAGQVPNVSPAFNTMGVIMSYLSGNNPYDNFRNRNIIPDKEFQAGYKYSFPILLDWLVKNNGAGIVMPSAYYGEQQATILEKVLNLPVLANILGRWVKVTDYGETEKEKQINTDLTTEKAQTSLKERDLLDKALQDAKQSGADQEAIQEKLVKDIIGDRQYTKEDVEKIRAIQKKYQIGLLKGSLNREMDALIGATSNDLKIELLRKDKQLMPKQDYNQMLITARKNKIISDELLKQIMRERLYEP